MTTPAPSPRLASLDQFRGYTMVAMLFVNFAGGYPSIPTTFGHHHTYCSFADTIMPQFLFAVGFAMRLTFLKRLAADGAGPAYRKAVFRGLGLILLGCVIYKLTGSIKSWSSFHEVKWNEFFAQLFKRGPFETLTHIGVTSLFVLPVIARGPWVRVATVILAGTAHAGISLAWYYRWNLTEPVGIDGGPLGFLTWSIPLLIGSLAYDVVLKGKSWLFPAGIAIATLAVIISQVGNPAAALPFSGPMPKDQPANLNYWTMSQRAGSITYTLFGAGFALCIYATFQLICDRGGMSISLFGLFGQHALATYIIHDLVADAVKPFVPKDAPDWYILMGFGVYFLVTWIFVRYLDRNKLYLRL
ncbi:MAG: heparan-alpha-glucosaminide N-acetyltransferase domain-containing protein [Gemmataceae bacterium]